MNMCLWPPGASAQSCLWHPAKHGGEKGHRQEPVAFNVVYFFV